MNERQTLEAKVALTESLMDQRWTEAANCSLALGVNLQSVLDSPREFMRRMVAADEMTQQGVYWMASLALHETQLRAGRRFLESHE